MTETVQNPSEEIVKDADVRSMKDNIMKRMKSFSLLSNISETCKFIAGPMFGIGIGAAISTGSVVGALPIALLAAAATFLVVGVSCGYAASRIWQSGNFDNFEMNAQSTAHHLAQELSKIQAKKPEHMHEHAPHAGKNWVKTEEARDQSAHLHTR